MALIEMHLSPTEDCPFSPMDCALRTIHSGKIQLSEGLRFGIHDNFATDCQAATFELSNQKHLGPIQTTCDLWCGGCTCLCESEGAGGLLCLVAPTEDEL